MSETYGEEEESILQTAKLWQENVSAIIGPLETCLHEVNILILISMRQNNRCLCSYSFRRAQVLGLLVIEALFSTILMKENILPGAVPEFQNIRFLKK